MINTVPGVNNDPESTYYVQDTVPVVQETVPVVQELVVVPVVTNGIGYYGNNGGYRRRHRRKHRRHPHRFQ